MSASASIIRTLLTIATLAPLVSAMLVIFFGKRFLGRRTGWLATSIMAGSFACAMTVAVTWWNHRPATVVWNIPWLPLPGSQAGWLYLGVMADSLTIAMMVMVTGIAMLVHLYSIGYMEGDPRFERFFAYLSLFSFSMMGIVVSNSLMQLFIFWELVGLTSYLLIGFWFEKRGPQLACKKAFVMNRIGDCGFLVGFGILFYQLGGRVLLPAATGVTGDDGRPMLNMLQALTDSTATGGMGIDITNPPWWLTLAGIGLFCGAIGKSAQFPLHTWLPDAMEGPTPVSSIVHSATMVAAGVYLTARIYPILTPGAHLFIAIIGLITLVIAACMALVMTDIKRVLAYSTLSQLGYMVLGLGAGAWAFAMYHLITHAFFKCCLFQCAGSVIHAAHHQQDMRYYGGLRKKLPLTATCYFICLLAIAGASIPFTAVGMSGFYSKDGIIGGVINYGHALHGLGWWTNLFWLGPTIVAYVTVFYMARSFALTFLGQPRDKHLHDHAHEAPATMVASQVILALMAIIASMLPFLYLIVQSEPNVSWVQTGHAVETSHGLHLTHVYLLYGIGWIIALGIGLLVYVRGMSLASRIAATPGLNLFYRLFSEKFYFDALYDGFIVGASKAAAFVAGAFDKYVIDGVVNFSGWGARVSAWATGLFDKHVVDGFMDGLAVVAHVAGSTLRRSQPGRIRTYVMLMFAAATVVIIVMLTIM